MEEQEPCSNDAIKHLRANKREDLLDIRKQNREAVLRHKRRLTLCEVEAIVSTITLEQFTELVLKVKDKKVTVDVLKAIKNSCCKSSRSEAFIKTDGALNSLIRILVGRDAHLQLEAAACLTNLACGSHKAAFRIAKAAGPYFVSFLGSGSFYLQDQSAWAVGNIANDCFQCFSLLKSQGLVPALLANLQSSVDDVIRSTVFALNACTKYEDNDLIALADPCTLNLLLRIFNQGNLLQSTLSDTAFTLSNILFLAAKNEIVISDSLADSIINCLYKSVSGSEIDYSITVPLVRCLGFLSQSDSTSQYICHHQKFKESVSKILNCGCNVLIVEVSWILTNILEHLDLPQEDFDLNFIYKAINMKNPADPSIINSLYFLNNWALRNEKVRTVIQKEEFISQIEPLLSCGEKTVENMTKMFLDKFR